MTYLQFHLVFVLPPLLGLAWLTRTHGSALRYGLVGLLAAVAVIYTFPWDAELIRRGVWGYPEGRVLGTVGGIPVEEVAFFVLQPLLAGLWTLWVVGRAPVPSVPLGSVAQRVAGAALGLGLAALGLFALRADAGTYLGLMLAWVGPVIAVQWGYGGPGLVRMSRWWALGIGVPTLYLCLADRVAIALGIWHFDPALVTGWTVLGLPFEEGFFFFATTTLVVQGLLLGLARFETNPTTAPVPVARTSSAELAAAR